MQRLSHRDLKLLMEVVREIYSCVDRENLPRHLLIALSKAVPSLHSSYDEIHPREHKIVHTAMPTSTPSGLLDRFQAYMHEHPFLNLFCPGEMAAHPFAGHIKKSAKRHISLHSPEGKAVKFSDVLTRRQFRGLGLYNEFYRLLDIEHQMLLPIIRDPSIASGITFNRDRRDFTERERLILNLLAPHILQAFQNAEAFTNIRMQEKEREVLLIEEKQEIPFARRFQSLGLTPREGEVLNWISLGKTNAEAAMILNASPRTIQKHLERIYVKLGVENRTAASRKAVEILREP